MCESFWAELISLLPQLLVTFSGVFLAFLFDRLIDWNNRKRNKKNLLRDLHDELKEIRGKLRGQVFLLYPDIWDSAISSGQIRLLTSEQVTKLATVYRFIKGTDYEAMRVRDAKEDSERESNVRTLNRLRELLIAHKSRESNCRKRIDAILQEKWWN